MNDSVRMQIYNYCDCVAKGCKPVAMMSIKRKDVDEAVSIVSNINLNYYIEEMEDNDWTILYIYKHDYLLDVIKASPSHPTTTFDHWILGKMFGYSDEAIKDFLIKRGLI